MIHSCKLCSGRDTNSLCCIGRNRVVYLQRPQALPSHHMSQSCTASEDSLLIRQPRVLLSTRQKHLSYLYRKHTFDTETPALHLPISSAIGNMLTTAKGNRLIHCQGQPAYCCRGHFPCGCVLLTTDKGIHSNEFEADGSPQNTQQDAHHCYATARPPQRRLACQPRTCGGFSFLS